MKNPRPDIDAHTRGTKRGEEWTYQGRLRFAADTRKKTHVHVTFPSFPEGDLRRPSPSSASPGMPQNTSGTDTET